MVVALTAQQSQHAAQAGIRVEQLTIGWMLVKEVLALGSGIAAHSIVLVAFGLDSVIELVSGGILLWRLLVQARGASLTRVALAERRSAWLVTITLGGLGIYIVASAGVGLITRTHAATSLLGLCVAAVGIIGMPLLARRKRQLTRQLNSAALRGDAACSLTCGLMAATLFLGLAVQALWVTKLSASRKDPMVVDTRILAHFERSRVDKTDPRARPRMHLQVDHQGHEHTGQ